MTWFRSADRRPHGLVFALTATVMLAGCTGGGDAPSRPTPQPSRPSASATPTASPTPTPELVVSRPPVPEAPEPPAEMEGTDALAAIETAEYFLDSYNYALASGDTAPMLEISSSECGPCTGLAEDVASTVELEEWISGGTIAYDEATVPTDHAGRTELIVQFRIVQSDAVFYSAAGEEVDQVPGATRTAQVLVRLEDDAWTVVDLVTGGSAE